MAVYDDFEDGDVAEWTVYDTNWGIVSSPSIGSYSAGVSASTSTENFAERTIPGCTGGGQPDTLSFRIRESSTSYGGGVRFKTSGGNWICGFALDNPEWYYSDAGSVTQLYSGDGYDRWIDVTFTFDWANSSVTLDASDPSSGASQSVTFGLNFSDVEKIAFWNFTTGWTGTTDSGSNSNCYSWIDNVAGQGIAPDAPSNLDAVTYDNTRIDLSWTDNASDEDGFKIYRSTTSGSTTSDYTHIDTVGANTTSYSDTGLLDGEKYYYRVTAYNSVEESDPSNEASSITDLPAPSGVGQTVNANDSIDVSWTDNSGNEDDFHIQLSRDGSNYQNPSGGPTTVGANTTSANYNPSSDNAYQSQIGIDSSFKWRVRARTEDTNSSWAYSGTGYTDPLPPHNPSISRPDGDTITVNWANQSDIENGVEVQYREDIGDGTGYGAWTTATTTAAGATSATIDTAGALSQDARYHVRVRTTAPDGSASDWAYADHGNNGNVYFSDGFESGGLSNWTTTSLADADSGVKDSTTLTTEASTDTDVSGPDEGTYLLELQAGDYVQQSLGDLSAESGVHVRAALAAGSMDTASESVGIEWSPDGGTTWIAYDKLSWENNKQGWVEVHADIAAADLGTDCRLRIAGYGGTGDYLVADRIVVSDVLHEYTTPAATSGLALDASIEDEIAASWTNNATFGDDIAADIKRTSSTAYTTDAVLAVGATSHTYAGVDDGERYDVRPAARVEQDRRGSLSTHFVAGATAAATTVLPAPTLLAVDAVTGDQADLSWTPNHDYGDQRVEVKPTDVTTWTVDGDNLGLSASTYTTTNLLDGEKYDARVVAYTEHTETIDQ